MQLHLHASPAAATHALHPAAAGGALWAAGRRAGTAGGCAAVVQQRQRRQQHRHLPAAAGCLPVLLGGEQRAAGKTVEGACRQARWTPSSDWSHVPRPIPVPLSLVGLLAAAPLVGRGATAARPAVCAAGSLRRTAPVQQHCRQAALGAEGGAGARRARPASCTHQAVQQRRCCGQERRRGDVRY